MSKRDEGQVTKHFSDQVCSYFLSGKNILATAKRFEAGLAGSSINLKAAHVIRILKASKVPVKVDLKIEKLSKSIQYAKYRLADLEQEYDLLFIKAFKDS